MAADTCPVFGAVVMVGELLGWLTDESGSAGGDSRGTLDGNWLRGVQATPPGPTTRVSRLDRASAVVVVTVEDKDASTDIVLSTKVSVIVCDPTVPVTIVSPV